LSAHEGRTQLQGRKRVLIKQGKAPPSPCPAYTPDGFTLPAPMQDSPGAGGDEPAVNGADDAAVQGGERPETPTQQKPGLIGFSAKR
jgi:hypothetical protein